MAHQIVDGCHMAPGQIHHMDIVPHAGAVWGGIIVSEYGEVVPAAHGHLGDEGHQVVGDALGVLADSAALMGAHRVEVAQQHHAPLRVRLGQIPQDLLAEILGPSVGIGAVAGLGVLGQGHLIVTGVDSGGGGENQALDAVFLHGPAQGDGGVQVVVVVEHGLFHALPHRLQSGEVDGAVNLMLLENPGQLLLVPDIQIIEYGCLARDGLDALHGLRAGVGQVVHNDHVHAPVQQLRAGVAADIAHAACYQNRHLAASSFTICTI